MIWAIVMAGGSGTRFWPMSRERLPKQVLPIVGRRTMIEETVRRLKPLVPNDRIIVVTGKRHRPVIQRLTRNLPRRNILAEPCARNTAPCLALAALHIERRDPHAVIVALPADHWIQDGKSFRRQLGLACDLARGDRHVVFGIRPSSAHTGFGYIACKKKVFSRGGTDIYEGWKFIEKPPLWQAKAFLRSGRYFWNSGIFVWKLAFFLKSLEAAMPAFRRSVGKLRASLRSGRGGATLAKTFGRLPSVSVDYGLMEKAKNLFVIKAGFDWSDLGGWREFERFGSRDICGNALFGEALALESRGNIVWGARRLVTLLGVRDLVVVDTADALLVAKKDRAQEVKKLVDLIRRKGLTRFL
jgi:mannose-1-phosphate guanylyltransferase